jgi:hypothetical protein
LEMTIRLCNQRICLNWLLWPKWLLDEYTSQGGIWGVVVPNVEATLLAHMRFLCGTDLPERVAKWLWKLDGFWKLVSFSKPPVCNKPQPKLKQ